MQDKYDWIHISRKICVCVVNRFCVWDIFYVFWWKMMATGQQQLPHSFEPASTEKHFHYLRSYYDFNVFELVYYTDVPYALYLMPCYRLNLLNHFVSFPFCFSFSFPLSGQIIFVVKIHTDLRKFVIFFLCEHFLHLFSLCSL